jgi:RNA polymerase sigma factor (sigma-70 family)
MPIASISQKPGVPSNVERAAEVFDEYGGFIRSVIRYHVRDKAEAEDLFQDIFLLLVAKPIPQDVQNVKGFLYRVISDTIKDAFRRIERYQAGMHRYAQHNARIAENRPENVVMGLEETKKMFELIERCLPSPEALALMLRYRDDYDTQEVAERMGVKPRSVSRYVSVGLKKIVLALGEKQESSV